METARLDGKVCVVTGANRGLGKATSTELANLGATVVMVSRDAAKGAAALDEVRRQSGNEKIELMLADLSSMASVRSLALSIDRQHPTVNVLVNNAAIYTKERQVTDDGLEKMFATNHLAPFLLTNMLLPNLERGAPARVITISAPSSSVFNFDDLQGEKEFKSFHAFGASTAGKLLFTWALTRRIDKTKVTANAVHPGLMKSELMKEAPAILRGLVGLFSKKPEVAARKIAALASSPELAGVTGTFFKGTTAAKAPAPSQDQEAQEKLWKASAVLAELPA